MFDICTIAHITKDTNITSSGKQEMPGGAAYYLGMGLKNFPPKSLVVTKLGPDDDAILQDLQGLKVIRFNSPETHHFENTYDESGYRSQKVFNLAAPFNPNELKGLRSRIIHLAPLTDRDISLDLVKSLGRRTILSLDAQGFLRKITDNKVEEQLWPQAREFLKMIHILKVNEHEATILTDESDMKQAAMQLASQGVAEVIITRGEKGSVIAHEGKIHEVPAYAPKKLVDVTGCGDTYMAGYLFQRFKRAPVEKAGRFGAAMATLKAEDFGPFRGTEADVLELTD